MIPKIKFGVWDGNLITIYGAKTSGIPVSGSKGPETYYEFSWIQNILCTY